MKDNSAFGALSDIVWFLSWNATDRSKKKRDFRGLWITRINAAADVNGISYSRMIDGLKKANVTLNRKMIAKIATDDVQAFNKLVALAKK